MQAPPQLASGRVPGWAVVELDALAGSGLLRFDTLGQLTNEQLTQLAAASFRFARSGFDAQAAIRDVRAMVEQNAA